MVCLLDLPLDVKQHVLRFLRPHELSSVRLTCSDLRDVANLLHRVLGFHRARVWMVCCDEDRGLAYTASDDGEAKEWLVGSTRSRLLRTWTATTAEIGAKSAAVAHPQLFVGIGDGTICEFDLAGEGGAPPRRKLEGHAKAVGALCAGGDRLVSGSDDNTVRVWDRRSGEALHVLRGHFAYVRSLAFDGVRLFSGSLDKSIVEWDATTGEKVRTLPRRGASVAGLLLHRGRLYSASGPVVQEWDLASGQVARSLEAHEYYARGMAASGDQLYSCGGNEVLEWNLPRGALARRWGGYHDESRYAGHGGPVYSVAACGAFLVSCSEDTTVRSWMRW